ncbi:MAG: lipase maturation factor family protein [Candidatus Dadabacteria bacterium]|nr:lipase maturation factor family protein [Candidatus Dadabacteria bacterium]
MNNRTKPLLIYDGDCGFCRRWIAHWQSLTGDRVEYAPFQEIASEFPEIPREEFATSVQLIEPSGKAFSGAEAVFRTLSYAPGKRWMLWMYEKIPGAAPISEWSYRLVAEHRTLFSRATRFLVGQDLEPPTYVLTRWLFLRMLGVVYLIAFISLWTQISGLVGSNGIYPVQDFLKLVREQVGLERYWLLPTLFWLNASDAFLQFLCGGGVFLSLLLILNIAPSAVSFLLWASYLSLAVICREFLSFQWDALLLETGFLAIFFAPMKLRPGLSTESPPSLIVLWLLRLLLFKLVFSSGVVKLMSDDPTWRDLTALIYHYETQPLPTWTSWYADQLPIWFQKASAVLMFFIELVVPFLIFAPRRLRFLGCGAIVAFQLLIMATGNYCFFNLLAIALCILLLDDKVLPRLLREKIFGLKNDNQAPTFMVNRSRRWPKLVTVPIAVIIILITAVLFFRIFHVDIDLPAPISKLVRAVAPFRSVNSYGLFAVMTTSRPEIIVEGSQDGETWLPYEFKYKPGDLKERPRFVEPFQPRLDWQMWFAALSSYENNPWFINFSVRLLQNSSEVIALLKENPFPDAPPRYIRAVVYDYRFTDFTEKKAEGTWWRREFKGLYCPILSLRGE